MAVRFPDVDVTGVNSRVPPETIDALKQIFAHYGHAGPAFVSALVANGLHREPDLLKQRILAGARARQLGRHQREGPSCNPVRGRSDRRQPRSGIWHLS
jgi:hypothetical protein